MNVSPTPRALRQHLRRHNFQALGLATASLLGAALLWGLLAFVAYWFTLLAATIERGTDPERSLEIFNAHDLVGPRFWPALGVGAGILVVLTVLARRGRWRERLRGVPLAHLVWELVEVLLLPANALLAAGGNLRALVWLTAADRRLAWNLLQAVGQHERESTLMPLAGAAAEVGATERSLPGLNRALFALQLTGLVTLREGPTEGWVLTLAGAEARGMCGWPTAEEQVGERNAPPM